jgi:polyphosphate kinase 2 (PPK2 family)
MLETLSTYDPSRTVSKQAFKAVQRGMLERVAALSELIYEQKRAAVIVFEGWDAAGKGTTIRALTERLDARGYKVLATQAPRTHEKQKPWLWRFWMNIPRAGQIAIFDRSWYGRVLVERVRGLTPLPEWIAAYEEINQFERTLADDGTIFIKFWLHISRQEQLRRFIMLTQGPATAWQVTAEDWENHRRYDEYAAAVRDMLANTTTPYAPWAPVDATNREYRMYSICRMLIERLEGTLGVPSTAWPDIAELEATGEEDVPKKEKKAKEKVGRDKEAKHKEPKAKEPKAKEAKDKEAKDKEAKDKEAKDKGSEHKESPGDEKQEKKAKKAKEGKKQKKRAEAAEVGASPSGVMKGANGSQAAGETGTAIAPALDGDGIVTINGEADHA